MDWIFETEPQDNSFRRFLRWATTPLQADTIYLVCLVWVVSFYAKTLRPKTTDTIGPPPTTVPRRWISPSQDSLL